MSRKHSSPNDPVRKAREPSGSPFWRRYADELQLAVGLLLLVALVFGQTASYDFITFDDNGFVTENQVVQAGLTWPGVMYAFESLDQGSWHPLTWISHMAVVEFADLDPGSHHMVNVALHAVNVLLLFLFLQQLTGAFWRSALVAAVFAFHPLHVEAVAWVAERKELLAALFWFLTSLAWLRWLRRGGRRWYGISLVLFVLGLMSKPTIITLPFALLLLDYWPLDRLRTTADIRPRVMEKLPFFGLSVAAAGVTYFGQQTVGAFQDLGHISLATRLMSVAANYAFYLTRTFWPVDLAPHYPFSGSVPAGTFAASLALLAAITGLVLWQGRSRRYLITGWFWFLGVFVPMVGVVYAGASIRSDRFTYMPHVGLAILVFWLLHEVLGEWRSSRAVRVAAAALVLAMAARAWYQTGYWRDTETLFTHTLRVTKDNAVASHILGASLLEAGNGPAALAHVDRALKINPRHGQAWTTMARIQYMKKDFPESLAAIDRAAALMPQSANTHYNRALVLLDLKREDEAVRAFQKAIELGIGISLRSISHFEIGRSWIRRKKPAEAIPYFEKALQLDPEYLLARKNLAFALMETNRNKEALGQFKIVAAQLPNDDDVKWALGRLTGTP